MEESETDPIEKKSDAFTDSEALRLARSVTEVQNFHQARSLMDLVVDQYGGVYLAPHRRASAGDRTIWGNA
jgi:hypothetical protein